MNQNFLIYSSQRSGSSYLMRALDDHPQVLCAGNLYRKNKSKRSKYPELSFNYSEKRKSKLFKTFPKFYVKKHLKQVFDFGNADATGFRLMVNHSEDLPAVAKVCRRMQVKPVLLIRKNVVRQAISMTIAQNAGLWLKNEKDTNKLSKIQLDLQTLSKNISYFQRSRTHLENIKFDVPSLKIYFEDLAGRDSDRVVSQVYDFIGVLPEYQTRVESIKKSKYLLVDRIDNYKETLALLEEKGLSGLITDD